MKERDCANCKHHTEDGCSKWDCEFERAMTREEAIQILADLIDSPFLHTWEKQNKALHMAIEALQADAVQGEWIPCSERLPEKDELVLVTVWNGVSIAWRNIYGGWESAEDIYEKGDVTAWMPLPTPYKGGEE